MTPGESRNPRAGRARRCPGIRRGRPFAEALEGRQLLATITVTSAGDADRADGSNTLSLRQAIEVANGTLAASSLTAAQQGLVVGALSTPNTIDFAIPGAGPFIISPGTSLPAITTPVVVDGYSEPGSSPSTGGPGQADNAVIKVEISGDKVIVGTPGNPGDTGLVLSGGNSTVQGLAILNFNEASSVPEGHTQVTVYNGIGIVLQGKGGDVVRGNFIGIDTTGSLGTDINGCGVQDMNGPGAGDTIGGTAPSDRNVISGSAEGVLSSGAALVEGNFIGTDPTGTHKPSGQLFYQVTTSGVLSSLGDTIGGTAAGAGNVISGNGNGIGNVESIGGGVGLIEGNFIGTDLTGGRPLGNVNGIVFDDIYGVGVTVGGTTPAARNIISGNTDSGLLLPQSGKILVEGNFIGTDVTGTRAVPNATGLGSTVLNNAVIGFDTIGGTAAGAGNVISGNAGVGLFASDSNLVEGNSIGTDASGKLPLPNAGDGILLEGQSNTIGGTAAGAANVIAFNGGPGVGIKVTNTIFSTLNPAFDGQRETISGNSIFGNTGLGIDLGDNGVTPNVPAGSATGANRLQPYPVLTSATPGTAGTTIAGTLDALASTAYTVEFFANPAADPSGFGQGQTYLGSTSVTTDASGHAAIAFTAPSDLLGQYATATATDPMGDTSEFAKDVLSTATPPPPPIAATAATLIGPSAPSLPGQPVGFAAVVAPSTPGGPAPTGLVAFVEGSTVLGEVPLNASGVALFFTDTLTAGSHAVAAVYLGDGSNAVSLSNYVAATVTPVPPTTILVGPFGATPAGRPVTFAVVVATPVPGGTVPTGAVAFAEGSVLLGEVPLNASGEALFATQAIPAGEHAVAAVYLGDVNYTPALSNYTAVDVTPKSKKSSGSARVKAKSVKAAAIGSPSAHPSGPRRPARAAGG